MDKLLEVREYELITCNKDYKEDGSFKYLDKEVFAELEKFILAFNDNEEADAVDFFKISIKRNIGKVIQAKNYVGVIQMKNGYQIQILPKILENKNGDAKKTFLKMLRSMKDFPGKAFNEAGLKVDRMNLYEIFINMYIQEVHRLIKKGISSAYIPVEDNLNYYKGKLLVQEHIKRNPVHKERFFVGYDEFKLNRPENKLIKSTLLKLQKISNSSTNIKEIRQLLSSFELVEPSINYPKDFSSVVIDRTTESYRMLMHWSKVFLMNKSFTTFSGNTMARALLFPMEKVFEAYVTQNLKRVLATDNETCQWEVSVQDKGYHLFDNPKKFALRPDIVIDRGNGSKVVLDTKWKSLTNDSRKNYGISQADMYQMYAYSKKYDTSEVWLIYPVNEETKDSDITYEATKNDNLVVNVFFVDVTKIDESLGMLKAKLIRENK